MNYDLWYRPGLHNKSLKVFEDVKDPTSFKSEIESECYDLLKIDIEDEGSWWRIEKPYRTGEGNI